MTGQRLKTVTRTYFEGTCFDDLGNTRDIHYFTADELCAWLRLCQKDAFEFGCSGQVNVEGKPYASFARGAHSPIPRCPRCVVRHLSPCLSEPVSAVEALGEAISASYADPEYFRGATFKAPETAPEYTGCHDCHCCSDPVYSANLLCGDCLKAECAPNGDGEYNDCQRPCSGCGDPRTADVYFMVIYSRSDGETDYSDGYICNDHLVSESDAPGVLCPANATVLEFTVTELPR